MRYINNIYIYIRLKQTANLLSLRYHRGDNKNVELPPIITSCGDHDIQCRHGINAPRHSKQVFRVTV